MKKILLGLGAVVLIGLVAWLAYSFVSKKADNTGSQMQPENQMETAPITAPVTAPAPSLNVLPPASIPGTAPAPAPKPATTPAPAPAPAPASAPSPVSAQISNFAFSPANITVAKGTTVTWTNNDGVTHTVTGDSGGPNSPFLSKGATYSYTFNTAGTFPYHCTPHPSMKGTVTVTQ